MSDGDKVALTVTGSLRTVSEVPLLLYLPIPGCNECVRYVPHALHGRELHAARCTASYFARGVLHVARGVLFVARGMLRIVVMVSVANGSDGSVPVAVVEAWHGTRATCASALKPHWMSHRHDREWSRNGSPLDETPNDTQHWTRR